MAKTQTGLLVIFVGAILTSCGPTRTQMAESPRRAGSDSRAHVGKKPLSWEQILEAANTAARERGWKLEEFRIFFDQDNAMWRSIFSGVHFPAVEGHDFQVVIYRWRQIIEGEDRLVVVDKNTGEVLAIRGP
jgi:hypothetical protein